MVFTNAHLEFDGLVNLGHGSITFMNHNNSTMMLVVIALTIATSSTTAQAQLETYVAALQIGGNNIQLPQAEPAVVLTNLQGGTVVKGNLAFATHHRFVIATDLAGFVPSVTGAIQGPDGTYEPTGQMIEIQFTGQISGQSIETAIKMYDPVDNLIIHDITLVSDGTVAAGGGQPWFPIPTGLGMGGMPFLWYNYWWVAAALAAIGALVWLLLRRRKGCIVYG